MGDRSTFRKHDILVFFLAIGVALLSVASVNTVPIIRVAENLLYDLRISYLSSSNDQSNEIVIVGITEDTLSAMPYRSPIDRQFLSDLILELDKKGVKAIGVDILFDQPTEPNKDAVLRKTLGSTHAPVIVATAGKDNGLYPSQVEYQREFLESIDRGSAVVVKDIVDGVVRDFPVYLSTNGTNQLGFVARISRAIGVDLPDELILPIDFRRGPDADTPLFASYPAHAVHLLPLEWFEGKIVLIGFELGIEDRHLTPLTRGHSSRVQLPGVQIHAQALAQLLDKRSTIRAGTALTIAITVAFSLLGISLHLWLSKFRFQILVVSALTVLIWVAGIQLYVVNHTMINLLPPTLALIASAIISIVQQWRTEQVKRQFVHRAFSKYMSADYVNQLVANPDKLKVGGEHREITFLFTDLSGFTTLTEKLEPELLVSLINLYLEKTCEIAIKHGGMVENIVGDALHVMFNAPIYHADHAQRAVAAAYELDTFCQSYSAHQRSLGIDFGQTRIGINTGVTVVGNFGGKDRLEYTAQGDAINVAARLESVNKHLGTRVCISDTTVARCNGLTFRPIGYLLLKGKSESVKVWEPVGLSDSQNAGHREYLQAYRHLEDKEATAHEIFEALHNTFENDNLVKFHLNRIRAGEFGTTIVLQEK